MLIVTIYCGTTSALEEILIETESFSHHGGWVVDQQFMDQMGSPYIMAHGLGTPVGTHVQLDITVD